MRWSKTVSRDLLQRMTLPEKLAQLGGAWSTALVESDAFSPSRATHFLADGIGSITGIGATTGLRPAGSATFANAIQHYLVEQTRLAIPAIVHEESTAGYCARDATQFPQAIGLAATWNPTIVGEMAEVIRRQLVAVGARHTLAPVLDIARDPRWGRVEETYGESPHLASRIGVAYVRGLQTDDLAHGVAATAKHFVGYGLSEGGLNHAPVHLGPRELREIYAEPFRCVIAEAGIATVMNAYNSIDGVPCGGSGAILDDLLRGEAGGVALRAGLDMELPALDCYGKPLHDLVDSGEVDVALVDRSVRRVLALKFALGLFEEPYVDADIATDRFDVPDDRALARKLAAGSIVVL